MSKSVVNLLWNFDFLIDPPNIDPFDSNFGWTNFRELPTDIVLKYVEENATFDNHYHLIASWMIFQFTIDASH